jgi:hypothetical protein
MDRMVAIHAHVQTVFGGIDVTEAIDNSLLLAPVLGNDVV